MTTAASVLDQICQFFGGAYDSATRTYRSPTVAGISVVRRSWAKEEDYADFFFGQPQGTQTGCQMVVQISGGRDHRETLPAITGRRKVHYGIDLHCFVWSSAAFAEDAQDFTYALRDAIFAKIRTDPTLGSGGIENPNGLGFQVGEGSEDGGGEITWDFQQPATTDEITKPYLLISFEAHAYDVG